MQAAYRHTHTDTGGFGMHTHRQAGRQALIHTYCDIHTYIHVYIHTVMRAHVHPYTHHYIYIYTEACRRSWV